MRTIRWTARPVAIVLFLLAAACGSSDAGGTTGTLYVPSTVSPPSTVPAAPKTTVATASVPSVTVFSAPAVDAPPVATLSHPNELGAPLVFLVKKVDGNWLEAMLPIRPNGITGWIQSSDVTLSETEWRARVELGVHRLTVWRGNDVVSEMPVATGTPSAPTPTGDYYLTELLETGNPDGAYGPYAFGLSSYSDVFTEFAGGPGQIGLHGTNTPEALGTDISHGCIRVDNATITKLAFELPVGSPITVAA
jgi:lipoprotein-anchoring transpeptidase ErfK/SrfK